VKWICCQLGARESYAIPRALFRVALLECLLTDAWFPPYSLLARIFGQKSKLAERFHDELSDARVKAFSSSLVLFETLTRARGLAMWPSILARNQWFQRKVANALTSDFRFQISDCPVFLSYSYTALEPFRYAKSRGWKTVLAQIDPGPEEETIVAAEAARIPELVGDWQPAPPQYWEYWRKECDLADRIFVNSEWSLDGLIISDSARVRSVRRRKSDIRCQIDQIVSRAFYARAASARFVPWSNQSTQGCREIAGGRANFAQ